MDSFKNETKIKEKLNIHVKKRLQETNDKKPVKKMKVKKEKTNLNIERNSSVEEEPFHPATSALQNLLHNTNDREKSQKPDVLTKILNQKKKTLMQDPEVVQFLKNILDKK